MNLRYRADHIGSLLRPTELIDAYIAHSKGNLPESKLTAIQDKAILEALKLQTDVGLDVVSDGEFRRGNWVGEFTSCIDGFGEGEPPVKLEWHAYDAAPQRSDRTSTPPRAAVITGKIKAKARYTGREADFLRKHHGSTPFKVTMPAASYIVTRAYNPKITGKVYANRAEALNDVAGVIRAEIRELINEGVPYIQIDNPHYPDYLMDSITSQWKAMGIDPGKALEDDIAADNACFEGLDRSKVTIAMHFCRGNGGAAGWHSRGSYESIAEQCFSGLNVDRLLLEYDNERAGGFEPLRFVKKGRIAVIGLITTKAGQLESQDLLLRRIEEASKYIPLEDIAISPQCGFASVLLGNALTLDDQRKKLELVVSIARRVWG